MSEDVPEIGKDHSFPPRFIDAATADLNRICYSLEQAQKTRIAEQNRLSSELFGERKLTKEEKKAVSDHPDLYHPFEWEKQLAKKVKEALLVHPLYGFLEHIRGMAGTRGGRLVATIGNPWKFPGQVCDTCKTIFPSGYLDVGDPCPLSDPPPESERASGDGAGEACTGEMLPPREGSGVRHLWSYFGLRPDATGEALERRVKGKQCSFSPQGRALVLGEQGIADQIVRQYAHPYRSTYDEFKQRKLAQQGSSDSPSEDASCAEKAPAGRIDKQARIKAAKEFIADLLTEWKRLTV